MIEERPDGLEAKGWRSGPPQADLEEGCDVGQGLVPCLSDSATHKGLPYVVYETVGQGLVPCLSDSATHKGLPYVV